MIVVAAKLIASGIASTGVIGAGIGIGVIFGSYLLALSRNPLLKGEMFSIMLLGFALVEATALFALMLSFLLLFAF
jgi:F-type H+-transporting ATPase subunit c